MLRTTVFTHVFNRIHYWCMFQKNILNLVNVKYIKISIVIVLHILVVKRYVLSYLNDYET